MSKPAVAFRTLVLVALTATMPAAAIAGKKCHNCDFSDEPIIVVGKKPSKSEPLPSAIKTTPKASAPVLPARRTVGPTAGLPKVLSGGGPSVQHVQLHCGTVSTCNDLIAHCAEQGGQWVPGTDEGPKGEPASGDCFID
jgi:hypothetical protein